MKRVLLVEDDPDILSVLELALADEGYDVATAKGALEALPLMADANVIVLDLKMPGMTGAELARAYRQKGGAAPIILLSATQELEDRGREIGTSHVIAKPFEMEHLVTMIDMVTRPKSTPR